MRQTLRDVSASLDTRDFTCEMQLRKSNYFEARSLYYPLERYIQNYNVTENLKQDETGRNNRYSSLKPVYALNVLGYNYFEGDQDALRIFEFYDPVRKKSMPKNLIKLAYFELNKDNIESKNQGYWRDFFITGTAPEAAPAYIKKAGEIIDFSNLGEEERNMALALEKAQALYDAYLVDAYWNGKDEGKEEGREEEKIDVARQMLKDNLDINMIMKYTNLSHEELLKLDNNQG